MAVQPAFLIGTYDEQGAPNFCPITWMSVTWDTDHHLLVISMDGAKKTKENFARTKMLSANVVSTDMLDLIDYFGSVSGLNGPKEGMPYGVGKGLTLPVPTLDISPWVYECELTQQVTFGGVTDTYFCAVRGVQIDETLGDEDDIPLAGLRPLIYGGMGGGQYYALGERLGVIGDFVKK